MKRTTKWTLLAACLCCGQKGMAQEQSAEKWTPEVGMELTSELQLSTQSGGAGGGLRGDYNYVNLLRLNAALPIVSPKSEGPRGAGLTFEIASLSTCMTADESIGGDLQTFSNLDAGNIPFALSVCNLVLNIGDRHSLFWGIRNMNEDYFCSPVTSLFTNSSCGIFPTISANYDIANYPVASVGAHYKFESTIGSNEANGSIVFQTSLYNGKGYNHFTGRENVFRFCPKSDGLFGLAEVSYRRRGSCYFVGTAVYWGGECPLLAPLQLPPTGGRARSIGKRSSKRNAVSSYEHSPYRGEPEGGRSWRRGCGPHFSPWAYAEQRITDRLSFIAGYSHAFGHDAACRDFAGIGGRYAWDRAELGFFADYANFVEGSEWATELTCKVALTPHFFLQPSVHAIFMPDATATFQGAATLRLGIIL